MKKVKFSLELPPTLNNLYVHNQYGHKFIGSKGQAWLDAAIWSIKGKVKKPLDPPVKMVVRLYYRDLRRRDNDNYLKLVNDAVVRAGLIEDDNWQIIKLLTVEGFLDREDPRIEVEITSQSS